MDKQAAVSWITRKAGAEIPADDCNRFIEIIETELSCLHEGNIARYQLRPKEFYKWKQNWK